MASNRKSPRLSVWKCAKCLTILCGIASIIACRVELLVADDVAAFEVQYSNFKFNESAAGSLWPCIQRCDPEVAWKLEPLDVVSRRKRFRFTLLNGVSNISLIVHERSVFDIQSGRMYFVDFFGHRTGGMLQCYDVNSGKQIWAAPLTDFANELGFGEERNYIARRAVFCLKGTVLVQGLERARGFVNVFDSDSGKLLYERRYRGQEVGDIGR